jgi:hypothetical protein
LHSYPLVCKVTDETFCRAAETFRVFFTFPFCLKTRESEKFIEKMSRWGRQFMGQGAVSTMRNVALNLSFVHRQMLAEQTRPDQTQALCVMSR